LGDGGRRIMSSRPTQTKSVRPYLKNKQTKNDNNKPRTLETAKLKERALEEGTQRRWRRKTGQRKEKHE
jgi:hypothetical protein